MPSGIPTCCWHEARRASVSGSAHWISLMRAVFERHAREKGQQGIGTDQRGQLQALRIETFGVHAHVVGPDHHRAYVHGHLDCLRTWNRQQVQPDWEAITFTDGPARNFQQLCICVVVGNQEGAICAT